MHASLVTPQETTPQLAKMRLETVKGDPKAWDMENIADKKALVAELREIIAVARPKMGAKELLPIRVWRP